MTVLKGSCLQLAMEVEMVWLEAEMQSLEAGMLAGGLQVDVEIGL